MVALALNAETRSFSNQSVLQSPDELTESINYEILYNEVLKDNAKLKTELSLQEKELISIKESNKSYVNINESLRSQVKLLKKNVNYSNIIKKKKKSEGFR